jgi:macrolide-specific efflux system membrane fusion protein
VKRKKSNLYLSLRLIVSLLTFVCLLILTSCSFFTEKKQSVIAPPAISDKPAEIFTVHKVAREDISDTVKRNGSVIAVKEIPVSFGKASGKLKAIHARVGDRVNQGDILAELHTDELQIQINNKLDEIEKAQLYLNMAELDYKDLEQQVKQARDEVEMAQDADTKSAAEANLLSLQKQQKSKELDLLNRKVSIKNLRADLDQLQENMSNSTLVAPIDGVITYMTTKTPDDDIPQGHQIFSITDRSKLYIRYQPLNKAELARQSMGMKVQVGIEDENEQEILHQGEVVFMDPDDKDRKPVEDVYLQKGMIWVEDLQEKARVGESVSVYITFASKENTLVIPRKAVQKHQGRNYVELLLDGQTKVEKDIVLGMSNVDYVEVLDGLAEGDEIILK